MYLGYVVSFASIVGSLAGPVILRKDYSLNKCPIYCPMPLYDPVCGSDGKIYDNHCELQAARCNNHTLNIRHTGGCRDIIQRGIICTTPWCLPIHQPVCGSDGLTYENVCELNNAMCDNEYLKVDHQGPCHPAF